MHGDFHLRNAIVSHGTGEVIGVLDWELSTLGDPLADMGSMPRWPGSHQGEAGADNGWRRPRSKTVSRTPVPEEKKSVSSRSDASRRNRIRPRARDWRSVFWVSSGVGGITSGSSHRWVTWLGAPW